MKPRVYTCGCTVRVNSKGRLSIYPTCKDVKNCPVQKTVRLGSMTLRAIQTELLKRSANLR